ncbi:glycosyltransferase family 2 protein [Algoriphagus sp. H41]|uniref:Glycosyltransferase family 2 protein n=1 Tax=Algoriphagus oliviformis TaxID=2811231 RepID=A0ABS3BY69_9BACT|nr:glycosyltransferase family 2 protein [Algoriphagus oliviformis]MBN7809339.1 glycosyltransferase family 2 protein [Algoriphagus oliviformis]
MKVNLYIPTLNAGPRMEEVVNGLKAQSYPIHRLVVVDSGSTDGTLAYFRDLPHDLIRLDKKDFDHGGTRHRAIEAFPDADIFVFLTQDAIPDNADGLEKMVAAFQANPKLGMCYGRQLPHHGAKVLEAHSRIFNYPAKSSLRTFEDRHRLGIRTISCSNSFAAYRKEAYFDAGGFPSGTILGEDVLIAGQMLLKGWEMAYLAEAKVRHSHDYSLGEEFRRYFDIGVFHRDNPWIFEKFGKAGKEGFSYLRSELAYVAQHRPVLLPKTFASLFAKWIGYRLGLMHNSLPQSAKIPLSMHRAHWRKKTDLAPVGNKIL